MPLKTQFEYDNKGGVLFVANKVISNDKKKAVKRKVKNK